MIFTISCAHHRDVRPGVGGLNKVVVRAPEKEAAERSAISQAEHYCEGIQKRPAFVHEKTDYKGSMDESTRTTVKQASQAARILGGPSYGSRGNVLGSAGAVGGIMTGGDDYVAEMHFKCE